MNYRMRVLGLLALLLLPLRAGLADVPDHRPMAVLFHADWCTNCKMLEPKYGPAQAGLEDKIEFVRLDVTDENTKVKARATANALEIGALYFKNDSTGWVALLNDKHEKVGELHQDQSTEEMHAALVKLAQGS